MKTGKIFLGLLAGMATGVLVGILFAPEKGSRTRRKIVDKGEDYADALKDKFDDMLNTIGKKYEDTLQDVCQIIDNDKAKQSEE